MAEITMLNVAADAKSFDDMADMISDGYQSCDVIAVYGAESGWTPEQINAKVIEYKEDIVKFATDEGLVSTEAEKKIFEYSTHNSLVDATIKFIVLDLGMTREDFLPVFKKIREGFNAVVDCFGNIVVETVTPESNLKQPNADLVLQASEQPITAKTTVEAKSISVKSLNVENAPVSMKASGDCSVSGYTVTGQIKKTDSNGALVINAAGEISIQDSNFACSGYNVIEIGLNDNISVSNSIAIKDVDFTGEMKNNGISIYGFKDNAVVNIENVHMASVSNALRISNKGNAKNVTINLKNVKIDKWEVNPAYSGAVIFQDYVCKTEEEVAEMNQFGPDKITINFIDCYGPHGKLMAEDVASVCATADEKQIVYVYVDAIKSVLPYDASKYPTITFK